MRFQELQVPAFGPFTNLDLTLPEKPFDLHLIYGTNEAGKSSLLRAIHDLLFGIPAQSADGFLHAYSELRIKGEICNRDGKKLVFQRRKGNKNTLLDADGKQLPDSVLSSFLGAVTPAYFSAMFGLGTRELREGAQELLRGEGAIGNALFSASLGGTPVQKVLAGLQAEAERIFKGRATANVSLRPAAMHYKDLLQQSKEAIVNPEIWTKLEADLSKAQTDKQQLQDELDGLRQQLEWLQRCEDALPTVGQLGEEMEEMAKLPPLPQLTTDFVSRAETARKAVMDDQVEIQRLTSQIERLRKQLGECLVLKGLLAAAEDLDQLHQELGAYRGHKQSLGGLRIKLGGLEPAIRAGMQQLQLTGEFATLEARRLSTPKRLACEGAASELQKARQDLKVNTDKADVLREQISNQETDQGALPETNLDDLREALAVAAEASDADKTIGTSEREVERLKRQTSTCHNLLTGAPEDFDAAAALVVPALATISVHREKMDCLKRDIESEEEKLHNGKQRTEAIEAELVRLQRQGELPTEEALRKAREHRDHGWTLVLAEWKGGGAKEQFVPGEPLERAFPKAIHKADEVADALRLDAEAVAQAEEKRFQIREILQQAEKVGMEIQEFQRQLAESEKAWTAEWAACQIVPRSPLEMEEWRNQWTKFGDQLEKLRTAEDAVRAKRAQIQRAKQRLAAAIGESEEKEYSVLFAAAKRRVQDGEQALGQRKAMAKQIENFKRELAKLEQSRAGLEKTVEVANNEWLVRCAEVELPAGTSPEAGLLLLQERKDLLVKFDEWQESSRQALSMDEAISGYEARVSRQATDLGIAGETTEKQESDLWKALGEARKAKERHDQLTEQLEQAGKELETMEQQALTSKQTLDGLLQLAGLNTVEELEPLLANLEKRDTIQTQIDSLRKTLLGLARGQGVDDFVAKVRAENPDLLRVRKTAAADGKAQKEAALTAVQQTILQLESKKQGLEQAGDAAADFRQQAESWAERLRQDSARYLRLSLATHLLQNQIEQFRRDNQGPLLQKSGEVFAAVTQGAFSGLAADFNANDVPILVGVRPNQRKVSVEGLSDGTRDQLYLALRLAALDRYLVEQEPMPLILDDLLITFDNERTKAILPQLKDLATRTQIFLFTHHEHLVELCRQTLGEGQFHIHRLAND